MLHSRDLTITLTPDEANAVMEAICLALLNEGEELGHAGMDCPGALGRLGASAIRIGALASLGDALKWRKHWGRTGGTPDPLTAPEMVWLDLLGELQKRAVELVECEVDDPEDVFEFDSAARTVARTFAEAELVAA